MQQTTKLIVIGFVVLLFCGCGGTQTIKMEGLQEASEQLANANLMSLTPEVMDMGEKQLLMVPDATARNGNFTVKYTFYEWADGELQKVSIKSGD